MSKGGRGVPRVCRTRGCCGRLRATGRHNVQRSRSRRAQEHSRSKEGCLPVCNKVRYHQPLIFGISNVPRSRMRPWWGNARRKQTTLGTKGRGTYLMSLWTTPRLWRNSTPERSERNHSLACGSDTSTVMSRGWYALLT